MFKFNKLDRHIKILGLLLASLGVIILITLVPVWIWWTLIGLTLVFFGFCFFQK